MSHGTQKGDAQFLPDMLLKKVLLELLLVDDDMHLKTPNPQCR